MLLASPAEDDQSAPLHVPLLPCTAFATPGTINASMPAADARALPALPAFSASAASAALPLPPFRPAFLPALCFFAGTQRAPGPSLVPGQTTVVLRFLTHVFQTAHPTSYGPALGRSGPALPYTNSGPLVPPHGPGAALNAPGPGGDISGTPI